MAAAAVWGCTAQAGNSLEGWFASIVHPESAAEIGGSSQQIPARAQQWKDVQPEVQKSHLTPAAQPVAAEKQEQSSPKPTPSTEAAPRAVVTSTMNAGNRQEAEAVITEVNKRLAQAGNSVDSGAQHSDQLSVIRKLRDSAQQAFDEQDYLTARSLAQKASILATQLPATGGQPTR
jgi:hypothetical protein